MKNKNKMKNKNEKSILDIIIEMKRITDETIRCNYGKNA